MKPAFADSHFFLALLNPRDQHHDLAVKTAQAMTRPIVTTQFVLTEVADACARPALRFQFQDLYVRLLANPNARIVPMTADFFASGIDLYSRRPDKDWSLTDCTSFITMEQENITDALTADHHFEQAGFVALLK